jgi:hypothetical protein
MAVAPDDPRADHWLWRLDADAWLRAAQTELAAGEAHLESRRTAVTHARRAAGMAINAVLVALGPDGDELRWGRSYIDHLRALADADEQRAHPLTTATRTAAARLLAIPVVPGPALVQLGRGPHSAAQQALAAARELLDDCVQVVAHLSSRTD